MAAAAVKQVPASPISSVLSVSPPRVTVQARFPNLQGITFYTSSWDSGNFTIETETRAFLPGRRHAMHISGTWVENDHTPSRVSYKFSGKLYYDADGNLCIHINDDALGGVLGNTLDGQLTRVYSPVPSTPYGVYYPYYYSLTGYYNECPITAVGQPPTPPLSYEHL
jgi:hypothetical protein